MEGTTDIHRLPKNAVRRAYSILPALLVISFITPYLFDTAYLLEVPQPLRPYNNANTTPLSDPPLGVPTFSWLPVTGALVYRLQVDQESDFELPIVLDTITQNTTFTPASVAQLVPDGTWFWRVRVEKPSPAGDWSTTYQFQKTWASPEYRPELIAPAEGKPLAFFDSPIFTWKPVLGAASYLFQISDSPNDFSTPRISVSTLATTYQPSERLPNLTYYWRIVPVDAAGHQGFPSWVRSFIMGYGTRSVEGMIPILLSPANETSLKFSPVFHWTAVKGAELYRLEYTTDNFCDFTNAARIDTHQTYFSAIVPLQNAYRYCWRVRAESGPAVGDWSNIGHFKLDWDLKPNLLTPTELYQTGLYPIYSWTPVAGASHYMIEIAQNPTFDPIFESGVTANTTYSPQNRYDGTAHYYWRVTPINSSGINGATSDTGEFQGLYKSLAPVLIYPFYYYSTAGNESYELNPHEDRTAPYPVFMWHRVMVPAPSGGVFAVAYRVQVDDSPYFDSIDWQYDTENTSASPTPSAPFHPGKNVDYYWRVCPLNSLFGGDCVVNQETEVPWWSQTWIARFDEALRLSPLDGDTPRLLRPADVQESVEATPLLEWWPFQGATEYQVQVSRQVDFSSSVISQTVNIPLYSPKYSLAQRILDRINYGTFYWHVRALSDQGWSGWSEIWRFQIASQSEWRSVRTLGNAENRLLIGDDPTGDVENNYDLTTLYASQSQTDWYFGFNAHLSSTELTYVLYIDLDNLKGSGALAPPERDYQVWTNPEHQPEYALYVDVIGGSINAQNTWVYSWNGTAWDIGHKLADIGGDLYFSSGYAELRLPNHSIGMTQVTGSASVMLFTVRKNDGKSQDTVPSDPSVPGPSVLTRFSSVSERMNLIYPPSNSTGDPSTFPSIPPFYWDWPTGSNGATPFAGSIIQVDLDRNYSPPHEVSFAVNSSTSYFSENNITLLNDILGDSTYYWRIQPRYLFEGHPDAFGAWTGGWSIVRRGFTVENLAASTINSIVSFNWDMAEGADAYRLQISADPGFNDLSLDVVTSLNSFYPQQTLPQGIYYWRVKIERYGGISNDWTEGVPFEVTIPSPQGLNPNDGLGIQSTPKFCWDPVVLYDDSGNAVYSAWKYQLQVSTDPNFNYIYDAIETSNHCWAPNHGYADGTYYWHVAMMDGAGQIGPYSLTGRFTKQYNPPVLLNPIKGTEPATPTFKWSNVDGAATYVLEVSPHPSFFPVYDAVETTGTQFTPTKVYDSNRVYYWRVAIRDADKVQGPYAVARFQIGVVAFNYLPQINR